MLSIPLVRRTRLLLALSQEELRKMIGGEMTVAEIPVTTIAQVLGQN